MTGKPKSSQSVHKFGTFLGVYMPSILTILGLIMYLRFGWVLGNLGLIKTVIVVLIASSITFITGLSASAIATNIKMGVGGEYFMISRSLGLEPGGAIGIPLYLCRTLSVTFYCYGLSEAILALWPITGVVLPSYTLQLITIGFIVIITVLSGKSAKLVLHSQIPIMIIVGVSILALMIGVLSKDLQSPIIEATYRTAPEGFWYVFAVFFPAVTGFTAGIGMSGDLKDPQKSIPKGTMGAVISGAVIYLIIPLLLAITGALTIEQMTDPEAGVTIWTRLAVFGPWIVYPAVWGAVLSSAFGSILGGPRILQALSMDGLVPKFLARLSRSGQPTIATWISGAIAVSAVFLGGLNTIAQYVSVLFLTLYVAVNISAAIEQLIKEPSYRPTINIPWYISILGAIAAMIVMWLINPFAFAFALGIELLIFIYLMSKKLEQQWGDASTGIWMHLGRYALLRLNAKKIHPRNWRPIIILFIRDLKEHIELVRFTEMLGQNSGLLTISKLITSENKDELPLRNEIAHEMQKDLALVGLQALTEVHVVTDLKYGMNQIAAGHGIAGIKTNTVVFGWSSTESGKIKELEIISELARSGKNILIVHIDKPFPKKIRKRIDIWWRGQENNGDLMVLLAYLIQLNNKWKKSTIRIFSVTHSEDEKQILENHIGLSIREARIDAKVIVILAQPKENALDILLAKSKYVDLVFLGLARETNQIEERVIFIDKILSKLNRAVLVQNNGMESETPIIFGPTTSKS
ncbi:amino acid transporter [Aquimarina sp. EL_43]|uniref:amino acid permease n=2 Tax=Flavobacteriaceae TaxID=49546 RepID=UPI00046E6C78|nr:MULTISPECIES: amino acid permease [Aquimarina]MBG6129490.1 amino acid transporter [Aquimarina sp. EL_35]MBG6150555.1 amino acid transporter [Aquimarina sp. EL_32]MBG6168137.1 amino acid transporter [Aquimarina sp. EL_43]